MARELLWTASMEDGTLNDWIAGGDGFEENTLDADSDAVTYASAGLPALSGGGSRVLRQRVTTTGGTRMHRYPEVSSLAPFGTPFYFSWWCYFPAVISFPSGDFFNWWQLASRSSLTGTFSPIWVLGPQGTSFANGTSLVWSPQNVIPNGPHDGESGTRTYTNASFVAPIGEWFLMEARVKSASDFTGALKITMDGNVLFDLTNIKTRYPVSAPPQSDTDLQYFSLNLYGENLSPNPTFVYSDLITIEEEIADDGSPPDSPPPEASSGSSHSAMKIWRYR
jgi:hypothetical protein